MVGHEHVSEAVEVQLPTVREHGHHEPILNLHNYIPFSHHLVENGVKNTETSRADDNGSFPIVY